MSEYKCNISDNAFWLGFWAIACICLTAVSVAALVTFQYKQVRMAQLGYEETTAQGTNAILWQQGK